MAKQESMTDSKRTGKTTAMGTTTKSKRRGRPKGSKNKPKGLGEKAVSKAQQQAAGIAHAAQKGEIPASELQGASKEMAKMKKSDLKDFASTPHKGLPKKK